MSEDWTKITSFVPLPPALDHPRRARVVLNQLQLLVLQHGVALDIIHQFISQTINPSINQFVNPSIHQSIY